MLTFHLIYIAVALPLTVWLAATLYRHGEEFLADVLPDRESLAHALNHLLVTGFFMLNMGWALLLLQEQPVVDTAEATRALANRLGLLLVSLGGIHFINLWVFERIRRSRRAEDNPPMAPTYVIPPLAPAGPAAGPTYSTPGGPPPTSGWPQPPTR